MAVWRHPFGTRRAEASNLTSAYGSYQWDTIAQSELFDPPAGDVLVNVSGVSSAGQAGSVNNSVSISLPSVSSTGEAAGPGKNVRAGVTTVESSGKAGGRKPTGRPDGVFSLATVGSVSTAISADDSDTPTGVSAAGSAGSVSAQVSKQAPAVTAAGSAGTSSVSVSTFVSTASASGATGSSVPNPQAPISGPSSTAQAGSVSFSISLSTTVTGAASSATTGAVAKEVGAVPGTANATGNAGTAGASVSARPSTTSAAGSTGAATPIILHGIDGAVSSGQTGTSSSSVTVTPPGVLSDDAVGSVGITLSSSGMAYPSGASAAGQIGASSASISIGGPSVSSVAYAGTVVSQVGVQPSGGVIVSEAGTTSKSLFNQPTGWASEARIGELQAFVIVSYLSGAASTGFAGLVDTRFDATAFVNGVQSSLSIGSVFGFGVSRKPPTRNFTITIRSVFDATTSMTEVKRSSAQISAARTAETIIETRQKAYLEVDAALQADSTITSVETVI